MKKYVVFLVLSLVSTASFAGTVHCAADQNCAAYEVTVTSQRATIVEFNRCSQLGNPIKTLVGSYSSIRAINQSDESVLYKSANGEFQLLNSGRFGMTLSAILNEGSSQGTKLQGLFCQ